MTNDRVNILTFFGPSPTFGPSDELFVATYEKASMHQVHHILRQSANVLFWHKHTQEGGTYTSLATNIQDECGVYIHND